MKKLIFLFFPILFVELLYANIHGSDLQSFNPASDNGDFVTVYGTKTLNEGSMIVGGFFDSAQNTLPAALDSKNKKYGVNNTVVSSDIHISYGVRQNWQVGLSLGTALDTQVKPDAIREYYTFTGLTDARLNLKVNFYEASFLSLGSIVIVNWPQVDNDYLYGASNQHSLAAEFIAAFDLDDWSVAANIGYNLRQKGNKIAGGPYDPVGDMWLASLAGAYRFFQTPWAVVVEMFAAIPKEGTFYYSQHDLSTLEGLAGLKYKMNNALEWQVGASSGFSKGISSPDYRVYAGVNWFLESVTGQK